MKFSEEQLTGRKVANKDLAKETDRRKYQDYVYDGEFVSEFTFSKSYYKPFLIACIIGMLFVDCVLAAIVLLYTGLNQFFEVILGFLGFLEICFGVLCILIINREKKQLSKAITTLKIKPDSLVFDSVEIAKSEISTIEMTPWYEKNHSRPFNVITVRLKNGDMQEYVIARRLRSDAEEDLAKTDYCKCYMSIRKWMEENNL